MRFRGFTAGAVPTEDARRIMDPQAGAGGEQGPRLPGGGTGVNLHETLTISTVAFLIVAAMLVASDVRAAEWTVCKCPHVCHFRSLGDHVFVKSIFTVYRN